VSEQRNLSIATEEAWNRSSSARVAVEREYLAVVAGGEEFGVEIARIREIIKIRPPTEVPRAPGFIRGVISVRGVVMPVLDLAVRLRVAHSPTDGPSSRFLVVAREEELLALAVDQVRQVVRFGAEQIEPAPALAGLDGEFLAGIGRTGSRMVVLLHLDAVLSFEVAKRVRT
jgi:purine-binding chemotaxis protein CheW